MSHLYIGVLLGAGPPVSSETRHKLSDLIYSVFEAAQDALDDNKLSDKRSLLDLASSLTSILEMSEYTNAGRGSELTSAGTVECDASVLVCGKDTPFAFASIGAVPNVGNPTALSTELLKQQLFSASSTRSVPNCIVGPGACEFGNFKELINEEDLIIARSKQSFEKWSKYLDTVGLILIYNGLNCVVSSSGGALLKPPGRVGPAFQVGSGLDSCDGVSAVCSGFGEDIVTARLASLALQSTDLAELAPQFERVHLQREPQFGVLRSSQCNEEVLFEWMHTTPSMICGYGRVGGEIHVNISRKPQQGGHKVI